MWTHWKGRRSDKPRDSSAVGGVVVDWHPRVVGGLAVVADPSASESSSSGDDTGMDAEHESLQEWDVPEASSVVDLEGGRRLCSTRAGHRRGGCEGDSQAGTR